MKKTKKSKVYKNKFKYNHKGLWTLQHFDLPDTKLSNPNHDNRFSVKAIFNFI